MDISTALRGTTLLTSEQDASRSPSPEQLRALLARIALRPELWAPRVRHDPAQRWYELLLRTGSFEVWLIGWWPGQWTPFHDHGGAAGALTVVSGALTEETMASGPRARWSRRALTPGTTLPVRSDVVHRVGNAGHAPATSIHAYSPPGLEMRTFDGSAGGVASRSVRRGAAVGAPRWA
ncbi:MAG TPA: cysteine dioxygenase family protein [Candidatus Dormibacteraeota bacterium]|jgi:predicted metal-dependent enzyme (double-stranded beta helix superfamily)|nr:cysteine dioxygenase family protein [Candidatus Dormibacteraeota bacterium]